MNLFKHTFLAVLLIATVGRATAQQVQRVVIIGFDGFSAEGFKAIKHPNIDKLFADGVVSVTTRPVMPSVTLPNWTSHLTGSGPEEHGVTNNSWTVAKHELEPIDKDQDGYYPSIFKVLKEQVPNVKTAYYWNWLELVNSMNKKYLDESAFEEKDAYTQNYEKAINFMDANRKDPTLVFLYSVHTDHAGHGFGWMGPEYIAAVEKADVAVGDLIKALQAKDLFKHTHFLLITDHGGINKGHGGTSMREMQVPWAAVGPKIKKLGFTDFYNSNKNTALVVAKLFNVKEDKLPKSWAGVAPKVIFK